MPKGRSSGKRGGSGGIHLRNISITNNGVIANQEIRKGKEVVLSEGNESQIAKQILRKMTLIRYDNFTNELEYKIRKPEQVL